MNRGLVRGLALAGLLGLVAAALAVPPTPAQVVVKVGDTVGANTVSTLGPAFTDGNGKPGFMMALSDSSRSVWWNTGPVFNSTSALPLVLTGHEGTMGVSNTGGFIYSPAVDGNDAVYTHAGVLLKKGDPAPAGLTGLYSSFNSRPQMTPGGTAYWIGGTAATPTGATSNRHLFKCTDPSNPATITRVLGGGDVIAGKTIRTTATNFDYQFSDNDLHHIHLLDMNVTANEHVYVDGAFVAIEALPTGQGDNWSTFDSPSINDAGHYVFSGTTSGATATNAFLAYDAMIGVREGDTVDGVTLANGAAVRAASINNLGQVAFMWGWGSGSTLSEHLFIGDGSSLAASRRLLSVLDEIDLDGDGNADYMIKDFKASPSVGPGLSLAEDGYIYVEADIMPVAGGTTVDAIIKLAIPEPATLALLALLVLARRR
jgi:hypothetical protein